MQPIDRLERPATDHQRLTDRLPHS